MTGATGSPRPWRRWFRGELHRVLTIEDPIEFVQDDKAMISQREVGTDTASFTPALKAALRGTRMSSS